MSTFVAGFDSLPSAPPRSRRRRDLERVKGRVQRLMRWVFAKGRATAIQARELGREANVHACGHHKHLVNPHPRHGGRRASEERAKLAARAEISQIGDE